jgi:hypothetical protein
MAAEPEPGGSADAFGFVNQHDRNVLFDWVAQFTSFANEAVLFLGQTQVAFAFRACQNVKQILTQCQCWFLPQSRKYTAQWLEIEWPIRSMISVNNCRSSSASIVTFKRSA